MSSSTSAGSSLTADRRWPFPWGVRAVLGQLCALAALHAEGQLDAKALAQAIEGFGVDPNKVYSAEI